MSSLYSDPEIPKYVYICGLIGLVLLSISLISFWVVFGVYRKKHDLSILPARDIDEGENALTAVMLVSFSLGLFFCLFIVYGHLIKQKKDPKIIYGPQSHIYIEFPETNEFVNLEDESLSEKKQQFQKLTTRR